MRNYEDESMGPLLQRDRTPAPQSDSDSYSYHSLNKSLDGSTEALVEHVEVHHHSVEDDVLPETATIGRNLGWGSAYVLIISRVIGSGIFATPGIIYKSAGSVGLSLSLWIAGALISWAGLAIGLEYGCMLPRSGGTKVYLEFTYRRPRFLASTLIAVQAVLLGFTASNAIIFAEYVLFAFRVDSTPFLSKTLAIGLLTAITIIHGCFLKTGIFIQNVLGWFKVGIVVCMVVTGLFVVLIHPQTDSAFPPPSPQALLTWDRLWEGSNWGWGVLSTSLFKVFYSFAGLENVNNVMNEVKNPVGTLKTVAPAGLLTAAVLYLLMNVAYFLVIPLQEIKDSGELIAALFFERVCGETVGRIVLPTAVAISAGGNVMVVTFALARLNQEIARAGFLPFSSVLSSTKPFGAPLGGLIVHYIPSFLVIVLPPSDVYSFILEVEGYPAQFFALAIAAGLIYLRSSRPDLHRPYKAWLPVVVLRILLALALIAAPFFPPKHYEGKMWYASYAVVGISILVFGLLYWVVWTKLIPKWGEYELEEENEVLDDGTTITKLIHIPVTKRLE